MFHGGLLFGKLLSGIIYIALGHNKDFVYIDAAWPTGIIPNTITFVHHTINYSVKIVPQQFEVSTTKALSLIYDNLESVVPKFLMAASMMLR